MFSSKGEKEGWWNTGVLDASIITGYLVLNNPCGCSAGAQIQALRIVLQGNAHANANVK